MAEKCSINTPWWMHVLSRVCCVESRQFQCHLACSSGLIDNLHVQGCAEIRWLAEKMGAKPSTVSGLSGLGDIMLTCYGSLSRNRLVILASFPGEFSWVVISYCGAIHTFCWVFPSILS